MKIISVTTAPDPDTFEPGLLISIWVPLRPNVDMNRHEMIQAIGTEFLDAMEKFGKRAE